MTVKPDESSMKETSRRMHPLVSLNDEEGTYGKEFVVFVSTLFSLK